jgi:hypothetical protein
VVGGVGYKHLVAPALGVEEGEAGTGMGLLPPADRPGARRPGGEVQEIGELGDLGALAKNGPLCHSFNHQLELPRSPR